MQCPAVADLFPLVFPDHSSGGDGGGGADFLPCELQFIN